MYMISGLLNEEYQRLYGEMLHVCNQLWSKQLEEGEAANIQLR
jgi:regulator of replication initiation timing